MTISRACRVAATELFRRRVFKLLVQRELLNDEFARNWITSSKALILLSTRGKAEDLFWFSFFHEAYHVLHGKKTKLYIAEENSTDPEEQRADAFAADFLIPKQFDQQIRGLTSDAEIIELATTLGVGPGIVAGRYRHLAREWV